jgi:hypothetical protein
VKNSGLLQRHPGIDCHSLKGALMGNHIIKLLLLCSFLLVGGCKKGSQVEDNSAFIGKWTWVGAGFAGGNSYLITRSSGVQKTLAFQADGILYVTHNDSPSTNAALDVYDTLGLLPKAAVDTERFQLGSEPDGCVLDKYPAVIVTGKTVTAYQYAIAGDTLQISPGPCLAPFTTYYVRN